MSSRLTRADVERIAALAYLDLTEDETKLFTQQLTQILDYAECLQQVDTTSVSAAWHPRAAETPLRPDVLRPSLTREDALANAPDAVSDDGLFKVPKVLG